MATTTRDKIKYDQDNDGNLMPQVSDQATPPGGRRVSSTTESYESVKEDWNYTVVNLGASTPQTISATPAILGNIWVDAVMSAHACPVKDNTTTIFNIPASSAAGYSITALKGTRFETSLVVTPNAAATGTIVVQWRPL